MATLRGAIRSYGATVRRIEREQQRRNREAAKRFKEQQKLQALADASQAVEDYNNYVEILQSVHKNCTESVDWNRIKNHPKPLKPTEEWENELKAKTKLENFRPSLFDTIFGSSKKKITRLEDAINLASEKDRKQNDLNFEKYKQELNDWTRLQNISDGIDQKNPEAYKEALLYFDPFSDIGELGSKLDFKFEENLIDINLHVNSLDIIPDYELRQTSTGKLSKKNMAKSKYNELYQDHICSAVIRIAREVFAYLPVEYVRVNAMAELLNTKTGHMEEKAILSVIVPPETIQKLNLDTIDPSDSMQNFVYNMKFVKTTGFKEVSKVELED
ncbi:hypothetical protein D1013_05710 [Euzebyella marina]|uniref:Uncharacterized protein n=1 Tax=Euzebyella marina TaxID=1761453 RepID=A0A3G2L3U6_9FLAO|nr:hypothetical protein [Euzebyella marina]AYN66903.1 hypothetical protein D1013_05710 [Euzebyella marina]